MIEIFENGEFKELPYRDRQAPSRVYLCGTTWYSGDQGDMPNVSQGVEEIYTDERAAKEWFDEASKSDHSWGFGFQSAWVEARTMGKNPNPLLMWGQRNHSSLHQ